MIKERCKVCNRIYIGESCACQRAGRHHELKCDCGKKADEVYVDDLGEWPMCNDCLADLIDDGGFKSPAPDGGQDRDGMVPENSSGRKRDYPYGLTRRQYDIASHSNLSNEEIAARLMISENTVHSHMKLIFKKLNVQSRHEIQHVLFNQDEAGLEDDESIEQSTCTISITIPGKISHIRKFLDFLKGGE